MPTLLTPEQVAAFKRDGYLLVRGLYTPEEMRDITAWTDEVSQYPEVPGKHMMYFEQSRLQSRQRILNRMEDIEPFHNGFSAHQDIQAGWDKYASLHITARVSIDASNHENSCLELAPGHHDRELIGESWQPLPEDELDYVACPTELGDAVFFDSFIPHRSGPNITATPRRVLYVTYNQLSKGDYRRQYYDGKRQSYPPDCEREDGREYVFSV